MPKVEKVSRTKVHTRYHTKSGLRVPGVTTVLSVIAKPQLIPWANKMGLQGIDTRKYVNRLASIGTLAHQWIEAILLGQAPDLSKWSQEQQDLASNSVIKFLEWHDQHRVEVVETEKPLASEKHLYGGTLDVLARVDGSLGLVDIKTSKAIYDDHMYQVAAYNQLAIEHGWDPQWMRVLQVGRTEDEGFSIRHASGAELQRYWQVFLEALDLYKAIRESKKRTLPFQGEAK